MDSEMNFCFMNLIMTTSGSQATKKASRKWMNESWKTCCNKVACLDHKHLLQSGNVCEDFIFQTFVYAKFVYLNTSLDLLVPKSTPVSHSYWTWRFWRIPCKFLFSFVYSDLISFSFQADQRWSKLPPFLSKMLQGWEHENFFVSSFSLSEKEIPPRWADPIYFQTWMCLRTEIYFIGFIEPSSSKWGNKFL